MDALKEKAMRKEEVDKEWKRKKTRSNGGKWPASQTSWVTIWQ
jgi:hypothetical protein